VQLKQLSSTLNERSKLPDGHVSGPGQLKHRAAGRTTPVLGFTVAGGCVETPKNFMGWSNPSFFGVVVDCWAPTTLAIATHIESKTIT
jgi:hypothetical protein